MNTPESDVQETREQAWAPQELVGQRGLVVLVQDIVPLAKVLAQDLAVGLLTRAVKLEVLRVEGRYPHQQAAILRTENIETSIISYDDGMTRIRLGDKAYEDMWMELTIRGSISRLEGGVDDGQS